MRLYVLLSGDPTSVYSAASGIARAWEEYPINEVIVIATPGTGDWAVDAFRRYAERLVGKGGVSLERVDSTPDSLIGSERDKLLDRLAEIFGGDCREGGAVLISSGGRRTSSAASIAAVWAGRRGDCSLDLIHVHFYFGPWTGLVYPYTPRRLHPLLVVHPVRGPGVEEERNAAGKYPGLLEAGCETPVTGRVPPLQCTLAELARRLNENTAARVVLPSREEPRCGTLHVHINGSSLQAADLCDPRGLARLAGELAKRFLRIEEEKGPELRSVLAWTGLAHLLYTDTETPGEAEPLPRLVSREKVIIDSTFAYYGAHRYYWEGADLHVPECLIREVHIGLAESAKRSKSPGRRLVSLLAFLALKDMMEGGVGTVPSSPGPCDTSIPKIDPFILEGKVLATSDSGALRYWRSHPIRKIVKKIVMVYFIPEEAVRQEVDPRRDPLSVPRIYYSVLQSLLVLAMMRELGIIEDLRVEAAPPGGERVEVRIPVKRLLRYVD